MTDVVTAAPLATSPAPYANSLHPNVPKPGSNDPNGAFRHICSTRLLFMSSSDALGETYNVNPRLKYHELHVLCILLDDRQITPPALFVLQFGAKHLDTFKFFSRILGRKIKRFFEHNQNNSESKFIENYS